MNTAHFVKATGKSINKHKGLTATGGGLTVAMVIFMYQTFATIEQVKELKESQSRQWQRMGELQKQISELKRNL